MAVESIGALYPTNIPGYADSADIQAALRAYHYGSYAYNTANTSPASLEANSIAKFLYDIEQDIIALENRPASGGEVDTNAPAAGDFTPAEIPDGFVWVDEDGSLGGAPTGATAVFTNSAPTTSITTGTIWVDKDSTDIIANPFIPTASINAKGDLLAGSANDSITVISVGTNGQVLKANSATTSGLEWAADSTYAAPTLGSTSIASGATVTTIAGLTLSEPTLTGTTKIAQILETTTLSTSAVTATQNYDVITDGAVTYVTASNTSNYTLNVRGDGSTTLNSVMSTGQALTIAHLVTNGGTAYYLTTLQIDGTTSGVTLEWQNGAAPSAGNINSVDIYSITIIKTGNAAFTAFAAQTKFA
jgi:hypothetical protein